jgi:TM2 domain-containing membrane protein YozV
MMKNDTDKSRPVVFVALLLSWLVPGAGHLYLQRRARGLVILVVIAATFWSGVAIGGVMTVDYQNERWWFTAEMLTGIHGIVGWARQAAVYDRLAADPEIGAAPAPGTALRTDWAYRVDRKLAAEGKALAYPTDNVARAYAGTAGLLNLMCMFDAVMLSLLGKWGEPLPGQGTAEGEA